MMIQFRFSFDYRDITKGCDWYISKIVIPLIKTIRKREKFELTITCEENCEEQKNSFISV